MNQDLKYTIAEDQTIRVGDIVENYNLEAHKPKKVLMEIDEIHKCGTTFGSKIDRQYMVSARRQLKYCKKVIIEGQKTEKDKLVEQLKHYYETDLDNCIMSHEQWINVLAQAMTNPKYPEIFALEYEQYLKEREA